MGFCGKNHFLEKVMISSSTDIDTSQNCNIEWFKKMCVVLKPPPFGIPLFDEKSLIETGPRRHRREIPQSEARISHGDHVSCKISFKKRDMP